MRYWQVPLEATTTGLRFAPGDAWYHCPLYCYTDRVDSFRHIYDWINMLKRGIASALFLQGTLAEMQSLEKDQSYYKRQKDELSGVQEVKELAKYFRNVMVDCKTEIILPPTNDITLQAFIGKFNAKPG